MTFYAIKQRSTGAYLPSTDDKGRARRRGFTYTEPSLTEPPRLFRRYSSANLALKCWLKGRWFRNDYQDLQGEYVESININPADRNKDDFDVVAIEIKTKILLPCPICNGTEG